MRAIEESLLGSNMGMPGPGLWCLDCVQFGVRREVAAQDLAQQPQSHKTEPPPFSSERSQKAIQALTEVSGPWSLQAY